MRRQFRIVPEDEEGEPRGAGKKMMEKTVKKLELEKDSSIVDYIGRDDFFIANEMALGTQGEPGRSGS